MSIAHALILTSLALAEPDTGGIPLNPDAEANKGKDMSPLYTMSCANHALQHRGALVQYIDMVSGSYPMIEDARAVFLEVRKRMAKGRTVNKHTNSWLSEYGSACPESYWKDKSIGYIWVGAGLPTKLMEREDPPAVLLPGFQPSGK
ncbi:MAG: hypothetical protein O3B01_16165 [Planctomycetota bacterium]|nr:hypothetical protein [Planctomycetota bacterium]MDA1140109.1 hypothetical protein [Planctomycetota bacterium]